MLINTSVEIVSYAVLIMYGRMVALMLLATRSRKIWHVYKLCETSALFFFIIKNRKIAEEYIY